MDEHPLRLRCAGHSDVGRRANNEDTFFLQPGLGLFVVADGMGGYEGGEVASAVVVHALHDFFHRHRIDEDGTWPIRPDRGRGPLEAMVDVGLQRAHRDVVALKHGALSRMGSTALVTVFRRGRVVIGNIGDSRLYRLRDGALERLTRDHSVAEELSRRGGPVAPGFQHCLTRAVGMAEAARADVTGHAIEDHDVYLLCTDGLWDVLEPATIAKYLGLAPLGACDTLIEAAHAAGSRDNITAIVVEVQRSGRIP